ncbi:MAG: hypothetical protein ABMA13_22960 [Chthoniobacteraceae bacterium]
MTEDAIRFRRICDRPISAGQRAWVEDLLAKSLALITAGKGQFSPLESAGLNGKSFTRQIRLTAIDVTDIAQAALDAADGEPASEALGFTIPDFSA